MKTVMDMYDNEEYMHKGNLYNHDFIVNISSIVAKKIELLKDIVAEKDIQIIPEITPGIFIQIAPAAINRVLNIILANAIKYNAPVDGRIHINVKGDDRHVMLLIHDTGIGIPPDQLKHIFEPYHVYKYKKRCSQGIGVGLSLAKNILAEVSAIITVNSKTNRGTTVALIFIRGFITPANRYKVVKDIELSNPIVPRTIKFKPETYDKRKKTIMIVLSYLPLLASLQKSLDKDFNCYYASHGQQALRKLKRMPEPDLIISDTIMDIMDGFTFFMKLKEKKELKYIPFLFLATEIEINERLNDIQSRPGIVEFMEPLFGIEELREKIYNVLQKNEIRKSKSTEKNKA